MHNTEIPVVLIPGGGGAAAIGAIKSLRMAGFRGRIVATDADPLSAGLFLADAHHVLPPISDPSFFAQALKVIEAEQITVIFPTSGFDTLVYSERKEELERRGVTVAVSDYAAVQNCVDKWRFHQLTHERFPMPRTVLEADGVADFPCFLKPIRGKGSRGTHLCPNRQDLVAHLATHPDLLIQEYLPGEEYSVDVLSNLDGIPLLAVPRLRLATKEGISVKGRVVCNIEAQQLCLQLAGFLGLKGPSCMQLKRDTGGCLKFLEVNPRMGGGTIFSTLAGVNIASLLLALAMGEKVEIPTFRELTVLRYYEEIILEGEPTL
jgi:carbamoyl-phosphate synthase large subunit